MNRREFLSTSTSAVALATLPVPARSQAPTLEQLLGDDAWCLPSGETPQHELCRIETGNFHPALTRLLDCFCGRRPGPVEIVTLDHQDLENGFGRWITPGIHDPKGAWSRTSGPTPSRTTGGADPSTREATPGNAYGFVEASIRNADQWSLESPAPDASLGELALAIDLHMRFGQAGEEAVQITRKNLKRYQHRGHGDACGQRRSNAGRSIADEQAKRREAGDQKRYGQTTRQEHVREAVGHGRVENDG